MAYAMDVVQERIGKLEALIGTTESDSKETLLDRASSLQVSAQTFANGFH